jgi:hypothetical protein
MNSKNLTETLRLVIREILKEGGLKVPAEKRVDLAPVTVKEAIKIYLDFLESFNEWLSKKGIPPITPVRPSGSSAYAEKDYQENRSVTYGDIDYLVSFPVDYETSDTTERRKVEALSEKTYTSYLIDFIKTSNPKNVNVSLTLKGNPLMLIVELSNGSLVQIDTVVTHPEYSSWMKGRYTPERDIKGYVVGNLYKALGDYLSITIGTKGVTVKTIDGKRVASNLRKGVSQKTITTDFENMFREIADYLIDGAYQADSLLEQYPGIDSDNVNLDDISRGILGLASTLEKAGEINKNEMLRSVHKMFVENMSDNVERKASMGLDEEKKKKLLKLNDLQSSRVRKIFNL